jgi:hypothetical protein
MFTALAETWLKQTAPINATKRSQKSRIAAAALNRREAASNTVIVMVRRNALSITITLSKAQAALCIRRVTPAVGSHEQLGKAG